MTLDFEGQNTYLEEQLILVALSIPRPSVSFGFCLLCACMLYVDILGQTPFLENTRMHLLHEHDTSPDLQRGLTKPSRANI